MSLTRQIGAILACSLALLLGFGYVTWQNNVRFIATKAEEFQKNQLEFVRQVTANVRTNFEKLSDALYALSQMPTVQFLDPNECLLNMIRAFKMNRELVEGIFRVDEANEVRYAFPAEAERVAPKLLEPIFEHARMTGQSQFQVIRRRRDGSDLLVIARPVYTVQGEIRLHPNNKFSGLLYFTVPLNRLQDKLLDASSFGHEGRPWILSDEGLLVGTAEPQHLGKAFADVVATLPPGEREALAGVLTRMQGGEEAFTAYTYRGERPRGAQNPIQQLDSGGPPGAPARQEAEIGKLMAFAPLRLPHQTWSIAVTNPEKEVTESIDQAIGEQWFYGSSFLLAIAGLTVLVIVVITRNHGQQMRIVREREASLRTLVHRLEEEQQRRREADTLLQVARAAASTLDQRELVKVIAGPAARACEAERCSIFLWDERREWVLPVEVQLADGRVDLGMWEPLRAMERLALATVPFFQEALRRNEPVVVPDAGGDPLVPEGWAARFGLEVVLVVPLIHQEHPLGVLVLDRKREPGPFRPEQVRLAMTLAGQVALAMENARLVRSLQEVLDALKAKNAELDSFVYIVSHDLKAPLVTIQGMSGMLLEEHAEQLGGDGRRYLERIRANIKQMEQLIRDLLALSRVGREEQASGPVHLAEAVDEVLAEFTETVQARGVKVIRRDLDTVWGNRTQVQQVMANLIGNAIKYMGDTSSPTVEVASVERGEFVECSVKDNGIGIDPAYHEKVFVIFQRLKDVDVEGTGVGLAIVKKIIDAAGGRIWVESARGEGSTFSFTWPKGPVKTRGVAAKGVERWNGTGQ